MPQLTRVGLLASTGLSSGSVRPSSEFVFDGRALPGLTFTRASGATRINQRGYLEEVAADVLRFNYDPSLTYNELPDPWFDAFTVGGAAPASCSFNGGGGAWTNTVTAKGTTTDGLPYVEITGTTTPANTNTITLSTGGVTGGKGVACVAGDTLSGWIRATVTAMSGIAGPPALRLVDATATFLTGSNTPVLSPLVVGTEYTATGTRTASNGSTTQMVWAVQFGGGSVGVPVSITARVVFPILHRGATPITDTVPLATLAQRVGTTPQYGLLGALIERISATNYYQNARYEGATPGVLGGGGVEPTGIALALGNGLSTEVIGVFQSAGKPVLRVRWFGTATATVAMRLNPGATTEAPASIGTVATHAVDMRIAAGTWPFTSLQVELREYTGGATNTGLGGTAFLPTSAWSRGAYTRTMTDATTTGVRPTLRFAINAGTLVDVTIDFALPKIELNAFASSPILPPIGVPAATTRAADIANIDPALIDLDKSSIAARFRIERGGVGVTTAAEQNIFNARDADGSDMMRVLTAAGATFPVIRARRAAANTNIRTSLAGSGAFQSVAAAWGDNTTDGGWESTTTLQGASSPIGPAASIEIGADGAGNGPGNNTFSYVRIWKSARLTAAQVQAQSARTT